MTTVKKLKFGNYNFDYENVEVHSECKYLNKFSLKELILLQMLLDISAAL